MGADPEQEIELPQHIAQMFDSSYVDNRAVFRAAIFKLYYSRARSL